MSEEWERQEELKRKEAFEHEEERRKQSAKEGVEPLAITVGTAIPAATTIDALFTALYATRSADLVTAGVPTYSWGRDNMIIAQWPALQVGTSGPANFASMFCTFNARNWLNSTIAQ
jgi:hypothetical protein